MVERIAGLSHLDLKTFPSAENAPLRVQELPWARVPLEGRSPFDGGSGLRERDEAQLDAFSLAVVDTPEEGCPVHVVVVVVQ